MAKAVKSKQTKSQQSALFNDLSKLIEQSRQQVLAQTNSALTLLFWHIGTRINNEILENKRAEYSKQVVSTLSAQLSEKYGRNFEEKNLRRMLQFAEQFPDLQIVGPLARQLSWSHFLMLFPLKNMEAKMFYADLVVKETLGKRDLRKQIDTKTFERTTIANLQNRQHINSNLDIINSFKDPYILDFLELRNTYLEKIWKLLFFAIWKLLYWNWVKDLPL